MTADEHVIHPLPPSAEEERAWRRAGRLRAVREFVRDLLTYATLGMVLYTSWQVHQAQENGSPTSVKLLTALDLLGDQQDDIQHAVESSSQAAADAAFIAGQLRSCLTPGESCYEHSQRQQTAIIQQIQVGQACAVAFAAVADTDERITASLHCVAQWYREHR